MFKVMMSDLDQYKQKADMSKQLATYFSPFSPITTFSLEQLFKQPQTRDGVINSSLGDKKNENLIKKQEKDFINLREKMGQYEKLKSDHKDLEKEFHKMQQEKEKYKDRSVNLKQELTDLTNSNNELFKRKNEMV